MSTDRQELTRQMPASESSNGEGQLTGVGRDHGGLKHNPTPSQHARRKRAVARTVGPERGLGVEHNNDYLEGGVG